MKEKTSTYLYSSDKILKAAIYYSIAFCVLIFLHGLFATYYFPSSVLLDADILFSRMAGAIASFFSAVGIAFFARNYLQKFVPVWFSVFSLGLLELVLFAVSYLSIEKFIENENCEKSGFNWSVCSVLSFEQVILSGILAFVISFLVIVSLLFAVQNTYKILSNKTALKKYCELIK